MFCFKKKMLESDCFSSPLNGELIPLHDSSDEAFATGLIGTGFAIKPTNDVLYMPFDGEVVMVFPTFHAIGLKDTKGNEYLIHIGVDTVNLNGKGFKSFASAGKKVKKGEKLIQFPLAEIKKAGLDSAVMVVRTSESDDPFELNEYKTVAIMDKLIELYKVMSFTNIFCNKYSC